MLSRLLKQTTNCILGIRKANNKTMSLTLAEQTRSKGTADVPANPVKKIETEDIVAFHHIYKLIKDVRLNGTQIGTLSSEAGETRPNYDDEICWSESSPTKELKHLNRTIKRIYHSSFGFAFNLTPCPLYDFHLHVRSDKGKFVDCGPVKELKIDLLKSFCSEATYGDLKTMTTKVNSQVRSGFDLPFDRVELKLQRSPYMYHSSEDNNQKDRTSTQIFTEMLAELQEELEDDSLYLEPYKLNLYEQDGHFKPHKDTPRHPNMIGTLVVALQKPPYYCSSGRLVVSHGEEIFEENIVDFSVTAFFCDRMHEITPIEEGCRVALTFSICKDVDSVQKSPLAITFKRDKPIVKKHNLEALIDAIKESPLQKIGILTEFDYSQKSVDTKSLKGVDKAVFDALSSEKQFKLELLPVLALQTYSDYPQYGSEYSIKGQIYRFTAEDLVRMQKGEKAPKEDNIVFFWNKRGLEVFQNLQRGGEAGNESLPSAIDNIYFNGAIIVTDTDPNKKSNAERYDSSDWPAMNKRAFNFNTKRQ